MPLTATIIFEGDTSVGQKDEVYTMELPGELKEWEEQTGQYKEAIRRKIKIMYNHLHLESSCKLVILPGEKY